METFWLMGRVNEAPTRLITPPAPPTDPITSNGPRIEKMTTVEIEQSANVGLYEEYLNAWRTNTFSRMFFFQNVIM